MLVFEKEYTIQWDDIDINQHANHLVYLREAGNQRFSFMQNVVGIDIHKLEVTPVLLKEYVDYKREALLNDKLTIRFSIIGVSSKYTFFIFKHSFLKDQKICAEIIVETVFININTRKISTPPLQLISFIRNSIEKDSTNFFTTIRDTRSSLNWSLLSQ